MDNSIGASVVRAVVRPWSRTRRASGCTVFLASISLALLPPCWASQGEATNRTNSAGSNRSPPKQGGHSNLVVCLAIKSYQGYLRLSN
jgi:hypothetical protein